MTAARLLPHRQRSAAASGIVLHACRKCRAMAPHHRDDADDPHFAGDGASAMPHLQMTGQAASTARVIPL